MEQSKIKNSNVAHAGEGYHVGSPWAVHGHAMHTPKAVHGVCLHAKHSCRVQLDL
jgi:hypothetical protein